MCTTDDRMALQKVGLMEESHDDDGAEMIVSDQVIQPGALQPNMVPSEFDLAFHKPYRISIRAI